MTEGTVYHGGDRLAAEGCLPTSQGIRSQSKGDSDTQLDFPLHPPFPPVHRRALFRLTELSLLLASPLNPHRHKWSQTLLTLPLISKSSKADDQNWPSPGTMFDWLKTLPIHRKRWLELSVMVKVWSLPFLLWCRPLKVLQLFEF